MSQALTFEALAARIRGAVEAVTANEPDPLDPFRGLYTTDDLALSLAAADDAPDGLDDRLAHAADRLGLDLLETAVLGLCAAPELDPRFGRLFGFLHDDMARRLATPRLVGALLSGSGVAAADVMACLTPGSRLLRLGAVRFVDSGGALVPTAERPLKVADRLAALLLGAPLPPRELAGRLRPFEPPPFDPGRAEVVELVGSMWRAGGPLPILVAGPDAPSLLARAIDAPLLLVAAREVTDDALMAEAQLVCALEGRRLAFDRLERLAATDHDEFMDALRARSERPLLLATRRDAVQALADRTVMLVAAGPPSYEDRVVAWSDLSGAPAEAVEDVAATFRLSVEQIAEAAQVAALLVRARGEDGPPGVEDLHRGAREASSSRVGELADRLDPAFTWEDLVVPERQLEQLKSISAYLRHRDRVLSEWGYDRRVARTQGLKVLFAGESGTGKTMSAQIIANELGLEVFRVDLATLVSKYIGETEKNLDRIFDAAEGSNAILFFDEADAVFGKRSDVSDAHDRYANLETAYLLQRMEAYEGAVVLATNYRSNIDSAFTRRLDFVIDFPFPEEQDRRRIWATLLPAEAPVDADVDLDQLAARFKLSGGGIRNCTLAAAFLAAEDGDRIHHRHMVRAVEVEYAKLGRLTGGLEFRDPDPPPASPPRPPEQSKIPPLPPLPRRTVISEL